MIKFLLVVAVKLLFGHLQPPLTVLVDVSATHRWAAAVITVTVAGHSGAGGAEGRGSAPRCMSSEEACTQVEHLQTGRS